MRDDSALEVHLPSGCGGGLVLMHARIDLVQGLVVVDGTALVGLGVSTSGGCGRVRGGSARSTSGSGVVLVVGGGVVFVGPEGILDLVDDGRHDFYVVEVVIGSCRWKKYSRCCLGC